MFEWGEAGNALKLSAFTIVSPLVCDERDKQKWQVGQLFLFEKCLKCSESYLLVQGASAENVKIPSQHHINVTYRYQVCTGQARSHLRTILLLTPRMSRGSHHSHHLEMETQWRLYSPPLSSSSRPLLTFSQLHKLSEQGFLVSQQKRVMMVLCRAPFLD